MNLVRRKVLSLAIGAAGWLQAPPAARADTFSSRTVHIMAGFPPGNPGSVATQLIRPPLEQRLGESVVVDYRPGAGGNVAVEAVVKARPDGGTLGLVGSKDAIDATLYNKLPFEFLRDVAMVAGIMQSPLVMLTDSAFAAKNVAELISYAKANPGKINMASGGVGAISHLAGALFQMMAGVSMVHVPYRGGEAALVDLAARRTQLLFSTMAQSIAFIRDGHVRALAVTSLNELPVLPGIPPLGAVVPGYEVSLWVGLGAPKATPADTVAILNKAVSACLAESVIADRIRELGAEPMIMSPSELDAFVAADTARWVKAVKFSGAKVD